MVELLAPLGKETEQYCSLPERSTGCSTREKQHPYELQQIRREHGVAGVGPQPSQRVTKQDRLRAKRKKRP